MKTYKVTWGEESALVVADNRDDAWARYCDSNEEARKHPNALPRSVELCEESDEEPLRRAHVGDKNADELDTTPGELGKDVESPVDNMTATDAIDQIGRMRSHEKLDHIVANDQRSTVAEAARKRLKEIGPPPKV